MSLRGNRGLSLRRIFWLGAAFVVAVAALVALVAVVRGHFTETDGRILVSSFAVLLCGSLALSALALLERRLAPPVGLTGAAGAPVALFFLLADIWTWQDEGANRWSNWAWTAFLLVLAALLVTTLRLRLSHPALVRTAWAVEVVAAPAAAAIAAVLIWTNGGHGNLGRLAAALAIVAGAAYLLGPILQRTLRASS